MTETPLLISTDNSTSNFDDLQEPPTKKCRTLSTHKPRLLEERIASILSCCICLDLSSLAMYQVFQK